MNEELLRSKELVEQAKGLGVTGAGVNALSSITSEALGGSMKPLTLPTLEPEISPTPAMAASAQAGIDADAKAQEFAQKQMEGVNKIQKQKQSFLDKILGRNTEAEGFYKQAQDAETSTVAPAQQELKDIRTKEADTLVQYRAESDAIKARGDITKEGQQSLQLNSDDKYGRVLADLAIRKSAAIANVADLRTAIDRKLQFQLAPIEREQKFFKDFLENNFDELTQNEKDTINLKISERDKIKKEVTDKENVARTALETALKNGIKIPDMVVQEIQQDPGQAYEILAKNGISLAKPEDPLETKIREAQLANLYSQINERNTAPEGVRTITGKPQTASQSSANGYADRVAEADIVIGAVGGKFTGKFAIGGSLPNALQSGDRQAYEQAKRNFVNAVLRRESGAAISPTEFTSAEKQYFPQAGDQPQVVQQKEASRNTAINNLYREANVARPVLPGQIIESGGKRYRVGSDGETLTEI